MSTELDSYKKNRINEFNKIYSYNLAILNSNLIKNYRYIRYSRLPNKRARVYKLINVYIRNIKILRNNLIQSIRIINSFNPKFKFPPL